MSAAAPAEATSTRTGIYVGLLAVLLLALVALLFALGHELGLFGAASKSGPITVPNVIGRPIAEARQLLAEANLGVEERNAANDSAQVGIVFEQDPPADSKVAAGAVVTVTVSQGTTGVAVPDVVGESEGTARRILERAGFNVVVTTEASADKQEGVVLSQSPSAGQPAATRSDVRIVVSSGKPQATVPDVTGLDRDEAASQLGQAGLKVSRRFEFSDTIDPDKVIRTDPEAGSQVPQGSTVTMVVSQGPKPPDNANVPDVIGQTQSAATQTLENAGFKVRVQNQATTDPSQDGVVLDQSPAGGNQAPKGSTVTISVGRLASG